MMDSSSFDERINWANNRPFIVHLDTAVAGLFSVYCDCVKCLFVFCG